MKIAFLHSFIDYPLLQEHKELHKAIIESVNNIIVTPAKLGIIKSKMKVVAKRALVDHIMNEDTKIKLYLVEREEEIFDISDI